MQTLEKRFDRNSNVWKPKRSARFPAQAAESTGLLRTWEVPDGSLRTSLVMFTKFAHLAVGHEFWYNSKHWKNGQTEIPMFGEYGKGRYGKFKCAEQGT